MTSKRFTEIMKILKDKKISPKEIRTWIKMKDDLGLLIRLCKKIQRKKK